MKNFIIGYGQTLTDKVVIKNGGGEKSHPYSLAEGRQRFLNDLSNLLPDIEKKPEEECANGEVVVKFIQHPAYLAKSYYPKTFFKYFGIRDVGSRAFDIKPQQWGTKKHPEEGLASCIYVAGTKKSFKYLYDSISSGDVDDYILEAIRTFEKINNFESNEKIKWIDKDSEKIKLEVVLHASIKDVDILAEFYDFIGSTGGVPLKEKTKTVGGLTFVPVTANQGTEVSFAKFSHIRAIRSMPKLRVFEQSVIRQLVPDEFVLPDTDAISSDIKVCIIDGGLGEGNLIGRWAKEIIPEDVTSTHPSLLSHGGEVCSAYLFGEYDKENGGFGTPYTNVDIVRVLSPDDTDPDLFDVLTRIENVIKNDYYKYVNLSLGPRIPIDDDDVHVWTSVLDSLLQNGKCLATVAIGNDGHLTGSLNRIQPPSDMVNCFSVGAHDSNLNSWARAPYSCVGPGRSPGFVKPDGVAFGGSEGNLFNVYSPLTHKIIGTMGTSYAAPLALRVAAGIDAITEMSLTPSTIKALMIHNAERGDHSLENVGWGRIPRTPEQVIECLDDEAVIVYEGDLNHSEHLRIQIPLPDNIDCTWVYLKATFCINTVTDPEHPLHYTRGGLDISFRPNQNNFKDDSQKHPNSKAFFSNNKLYMKEQEYRDDAHKWETCISKEQRFKRTSLDHPIFDVKYHSREQGATASQKLEPLPYSLIVSIRAAGDTSVYNKVLQQYQTLLPVRVRGNVQVTL